MQNIINRVFKHESLINQPPVLIDIGASLALPEHWKPLAKYSICIAFDADTRDFAIEESANGDWKKLYSMNRLVAADPSDGINFYLTKSPYCSSSLMPNLEALKPWAIQDLFTVDQVVQLPATDLNSVLSKIGLSHIDWFKTDTQGTDLRIFNSLHEDVQAKILVADFEPGIIDAYIGEDKLYSIMAYMHQKPFWVSDMDVKGTQRIYDSVPQDPYQQRAMRSLLKTSPGWCEIAYMNNLDSETFTVREYLLAWVFATIKGQHGFAMHVAIKGLKSFNEPIFADLEKHSRNKISYSPNKLAILKLRGLVGAILRKLRIK